jgi:hypothetical protein
MTSSWKRRTAAVALLAVAGGLALWACASGARPAPAPRTDLGAGFRFSVYGPRTNPGPQYWARVGREMAARFPGATPTAVWIVTRVKDRGALLNFPVTSDDPLIAGSAEDGNEASLRLFDSLGFRIWLQVEPGFANVEKLLRLVLDRYAKHPCVVGVGIDVEWYRSVDPDAGDPVSDDDARAWLAVARSYNPAYRLFLKHWLEEKMPPTARDGMLFINDSQIFPSVDAMIEDFATWAKTFAPTPVGFQYGYNTDRPWWSLMSDPPAEIGRRILVAAPNTEVLLWVDFSVNEVFPPDGSAWKPAQPAATGAAR